MQCDQFPTVGKGMCRELPGIFSTLVQNEPSQAIPRSQIPPAPGVLIFQLPPGPLLKASTCWEKALGPGGRSAEHGQVGAACRECPWSWARGCGGTEQCHGLPGGRQGEPGHRDRHPGGSERGGQGGGSTWAVLGAVPQGPSCLCESGELNGEGVVFFFSTQHVPLHISTY